MIFDVVGIIRFWIARVVMATIEGFTLLDLSFVEVLTSLSVFRKVSLTSNLALKMN